MTLYPDEIDDWSDHEVLKPWEQCTDSEKWRKLWMKLRGVNESRRLHGLHEVGELRELRKRRNGGKPGGEKVAPLTEKEAAQLAKADKHDENAMALQRWILKRMCELLRESKKPLPYEGRMLLAELLDSKRQYFDVQLELRKKSYFEFERRREKDFKWGAEVENEVKQHALASNKAIRNRFGSEQVRRVKRRQKTPTYWYREFRAPWDES
jgi:hypothetical protein